MSKWKGVFLCLMAVSLLGCTASPHVSYVKVTPDNAWDHLDHLKFSLASTLVKIDCGTEQQPKPDQADETAPANNANQTNPSRKNNPTDDPASNTNGCPNGLKLLATVVPVDSATIYAMVPRYVWFMRTDLSATYVDESRVAQKWGSRCRTTESPSSRPLPLSQVWPLPKYP